MDSSYCDPPDKELIFRIVSELVVQSDLEPSQLAPIAKSIDPDALEKLITGSRGSEICVTFWHEGYRVTIDSTAAIDIDSGD